MRLYCVNDGVPGETVALLSTACAARQVEFIEVESRRFDYRTAAPLAGGDMLFRPAVSTLAMCVEQFLMAEGVATFYRDREAFDLHPVSSSLWFERSGLPVPRTVPSVGTDRGLLRRYAEWLGGFPLVVKVPGGEGGVGVMRVDSLPALISVVDYLCSTGRPPVLMSYVAEALHWRVIVVGERAVAAYPNSQETDDFRSAASTDVDEMLAVVPPELAALAVRAVRAMRVEFGGVDILVHASGRLYLLEANMPCYFAHAQTIAGIDIAGAMVEHLLAKRRSG